MQEPPRKPCDQNDHDDSDHEINQREGSGVSLFDAHVAYLPVRAMKLLRDLLPGPRATVPQGRRGCPGLSPVVELPE